MKLYLIFLSFLIVGFVDAQILPQALIANNNAYPSTISANASFDLLPIIENKNTKSPYPNIVSNVTFSFTESTPFTIQFLVKGNGFSYINEAKMRINGNTGFILAFAPTINLNADFSNIFIGYRISPTSIDRVNNGMFTTEGSFSLPATFGETYQITETYNGTKDSIYINGVFYAESTRTGTGSFTTSPLYLVLGNNAAYTTCIIDEVRFWNKKLTKDEISKNWNKPLTGNEDGLKLYYNFNNQGYADEDNTKLSYLKDQTANNYIGVFINTSLTGSQQNFVTDITQTNIKDSSVVTFDANILDSYPGNDRGTIYGNTNNKSAFIVHDLYTTSNLIFYNSSSYDVNQLAAPILSADGGRSFLINNIYGKTNTLSGISGYNRRTFEAWVKLNSLDNISIVSIGTYTDNDLFEMAVDNGKLILNIGPNFSSKLNLKSNRTLQTNTWYHLVIANDPWLSLSQSTNFYNIYINGVLDNNWLTQVLADASKTSIDAIFTNLNTTNTNIYIGNSLRPFNGKLGSLKIYQRVLSATEILNRFNATKSRFGY
jgi:hypothetical protein